MNERREEAKKRRREKRQKLYDALWKKAKRLVPPGFHIERERNLYIAGIALAGLYMLVSFTSKWKVAYDNLFEWIGQKRVMRVGAVMPGFVYCMMDTHWGFAVLAGFVFIAVLWHYSYYYQGSKSIYVMKRLPNRLEIHKRAWVLPIVSEIGLMLAMVLMTLLCLGFYFVFSPAECIPEQWFLG